MNSTKFRIGESHISDLPRVFICEWEVQQLKAPISPFAHSEASNRGTFTGSASPTVGNHKTQRMRSFRWQVTVGTSNSPKQTKKQTQMHRTLHLIHDSPWAVNHVLKAKRERHVSFHRPWFWRTKKIQRNWEIKTVSLHVNKEDCNVLELMSSLGQVGLSKRLRRQKVSFVCNPRSPLRLEITLL